MHLFLQYNVNNLCSKVRMICSILTVNPGGEILSMLIKNAEFRTSFGYFPDMA